MLKTIQRLLCRHDIYWSERRQGHVCYKCGRFEVDGVRVAAHEHEVEPEADSGSAPHTAEQTLVCRADVRFAEAVLR